MIFKKYKLIILILLVTLPMMSILKAFGLSQAKQDYPYMPRQINLSGNIVKFSIPENFSLDFPADDLVEVLNLNDEKLFQDEKPITLLRRWWDFKDDSFFSKDVGSMMMTVHIYRTKNTSEDISHPIEFIKVLLAEMEIRDKEENEGRSESDKVYFPEFYQSFGEKTHNNQRWLRGGGADTYETQMAFHEWVQITPAHFLGVEFHFAPNTNLSMRTFLDTYCRDMQEKIMSTFNIIYSNDNAIKLKLDKNNKLDIKKLIEELE